MAAYIAGLVGLIAVSAEASESHCTAREQIVFSCPVGEEWVSVCASSDLSPSSGYLQYRFGKIGKPELVFPELIFPASFFIRVGTLLFAGGGGGYVRFIDAPYQYVVYAAISKDWGQKDGVAVLKDDRLIANRVCRDVPISKFSEAFFSQTGLPVDQWEFEVP